MGFLRNNKLFKLTPLLVAISAASTLQLTTTFAGDIPPGYFLAPNGKIMANNPKTAIAPPGYYLRRNGTLVKVDKELDLSTPASAFAPASTFAPAVTVADGEVPSGFHKMPNGEVMANDPMSAVAPPGYHLMPNGILMANNTGHHGAGMLMFDLKYSYMYMKDMLDQTKKVTASQAVTPTANNGYGFMMAPVDMSMHMTMAMVMYGVTDSFMVMGMGHYMKKNMGMLSSDGTTSTMTSSGIADTVISGMLQGPHNLTFNVGLSLPTGSTNIRGPMTHNQTFTQNNVKYPYGMQLGSGSYDLKHGISYSDVEGDIGWGGSYEYTSRMNKNNGYKWGNQFIVDSWIRWDVTKQFNTTAKIAYHALGQIEGADPDLALQNDTTGTDFTIMSPAMDATSYGGRRLDLGLGAKYTINEYSVTTELSMPVYQNLAGPQMATKWIASLNLGAMF